MKPLKRDVMSVKKCVISSVSAEKHFIKRIDIFLFQFLKLENKILIPERSIHEILLSHYLRRSQMINHSFLFSAFLFWSFRLKIRRSRSGIGGSRGLLSGG